MELDFRLPSSDRKHSPLLPLTPKPKQLEEASQTVHWQGQTPSTQALPFECFPWLRSTEEDRTCSVGTYYQLPPISLVFRFCFPPILPAVCCSLLLLVCLDDAQLMVTNDESSLQGERAGEQSINQSINQIQ